MKPTMPLRQSALDPKTTAILMIDTQKGIFNAGAAQKRPYFHQTAKGIAIPNMAKLIAAGRKAKAEVIYTVIASLTQDGRDRSLDYKQSNFHFPAGSPETEVIEELGPIDDEIILPKTSSSLFNSTIFEYLMRNIGIDTVVVAGFLTDQCIDHTVRDGADRGFRMVCPIDACTTDSQSRHDNALAAFKGYCRQAETSVLVDELLRGHA
jgi:nicotinamidase-related amidase